MEPTRHGENIVEQINEPDAYGNYNELNLADVWLIIDQLHTHFMDAGKDTKFLSRWLRELEDMDKNLPPI